MKGFTFGAEASCHLELCFLATVTHCKPPSFILHAVAVIVWSLMCVLLYKCYHIHACVFACTHTCCLLLIAASESTRMLDLKRDKKAKQNPPQNKTKNPLMNSPLSWSIDFKVSCLPKAGLVFVFRRAVWLQPDTVTAKHLILFSLWRCSKCKGGSAEWRYYWYWQRLRWSFLMYLRLWLFYNLL